MAKTKSQVQSEIEPIFQIKAGLYPLTSIQILHNRFKELGSQLDTKLAEAPKFFQNAPVIIDLQKVNQASLKIDFLQLKETLNSRNLILIGIKGGHPDQQSAAISAGCAVLPDNIHDKDSSKDNTQDNSKDSAQDKSRQSGKETSASGTESEKKFKNLGSEIIGSNTKVIKEPVRSGTQIYVREGDLIVLGPVSHGAELLADGHIHVYGTLRGRALAGITGDTEAQIFCQSLEAELISIAGQYKISEDIDQKLWRRSVKIYLENEHLQLQPL